MVNLKRMNRLKTEIIGKKNQEFVRFQLIPNKTRQRGKYLTTLGYWDTRQNRQTRYIVLNIGYKLFQKNIIKLIKIKNIPLKFKNFIFFTDTAFMESGQESLTLSNRSSFEKTLLVNNKYFFYE